MKKIGIYFIAIVVISALLVTFSPGGWSSGGSGSGKRRYSDLNDIEKANARWAYEAKQAIDSYGR